MYFSSFVGRSRRKNMDGPLELVELCSPLWVNLTVEEGRSVFSRKCREAMGGGFVRGGFLPMADPESRL